MKVFLLLVLIAFNSMAGENDRYHMPKSFAVNGGRAVFTDFYEAIYQINYDISQKKAFVVAEIGLQVLEAGYPIFDSVENPTSVSFDGVPVQTVLSKTPSGETTVRIVNKFAAVGNHILRVEVPLNSLVEFTGDGGVKSAFWTSDLSERQFLERYLPANFEFDQVKMTFHVNFIGAKTNQIIYTNGNVSQKSVNSFKIAYPAYYTSSSIFFHTVPHGATKELRFTLKSIDGRNIPTVVYAATNSYGASLEVLARKTAEIFQELESDYGAFPHPSLTVLQAGRGGMEYCGATMTELAALGHELFHSYFARGVMPANGNSGWVDEALASWRDNGYRAATSMSGSSNMSSRPYYTRTTDRSAYTFGERFMRYLDGKLEAKGGLKPFMRYMMERRVFNPIFVEEFIAEMSRFYGVQLEGDFKQFTYGRKGKNPYLKQESHFHQKMTLEEMKNYL